MTDFLLLAGRKRPLFVRLQKKIKKAVEVLEYFTTKQWEFTNDNFYMIMKELNETDNQMFNFDLKELNWKSYIEQYCLGTKVYLMKEDAKKLNECRIKIIKYKIIKEKIKLSINFKFNIFKKYEKKKRLYFVHCFSIHFSSFYHEN